MDETFKKKFTVFARSILQPWSEFLLPRICLGCGRRSQGEMGLCFSCYRNLRQCRRWKTVLELGKLTHGLPLNSLQAFYRQGRVVRKLIHSLKYRDYCSALPALTAPLERFSKRKIEIAHVDLIVSVPLHAARWRERGFNQADRIAEKISLWTGIPIEKRVLKRRRYTQTQTEKSMDERGRNMENAFHCVATDSLKGKRILVVDDVVTTGATLSACAKALISAGASEVNGLAILAVEAEFQTKKSTQIDFDLELDSDFFRSARELHSPHHGMD